MAHFAEIGLNNVVERVIVVHNNELLDENGVEVEQKGIDFCKSLFGGTWVQTSYNGNFRGCFAGKGFVYDAENDVFVAPDPEDHIAVADVSTTSGAYTAMHSDNDV